MRLSRDPWDMLMLVALTLVILTFIITRKEIKRNVYRPVKKERRVEVIEDSTFTPQKLLIYLRDIGVKHAEIVYAQAVLETGNFKSKGFKMCNNLFGMRVARSRPTSALGEKFGYAYFKDWRMSVIDYALFQSAYARKIRTKSGYYEYLSRNYASDAGYINKLKKIVAEI